MDRYTIVQHDAWADDLVEVGENKAGRMVRVNRHYMEANKRILTGFVEPHFFAGFSGGPKAVLPGIADIESIMDNHGATSALRSNGNMGDHRGKSLVGRDPRYRHGYRSDIYFQCDLE